MPKGLGQLVLLVVLFVPLLLIFSSNRKRQRSMLTLQQDLEPGREIMTTAGLYATVVEVHPDHVLLETAPGQRSRWARQSVARVVSTPTPAVTDDVRPSPVTGPDIDLTKSPPRTTPPAGE